MKTYEEQISDFNEIQKSHINSTIVGTKEYFIKSIVDELVDRGYSGDELLTKAKEKLSGGRWVTVNGNHVYIKGGKVEAGTIHTGDSDNKKVTTGEKIKQVKSDTSRDRESKTLSLSQKIQSVPSIGTYSYSKGDLKRVKPEQWKDVWGRWDKTSNMIDGINLFGKSKVSDSGNKTLEIPEAKRGVYKQGNDYWFFHTNRDGSKSNEGMVSSGKFKDTLDKIFDREFNDNSSENKKERT